MMTREQMHTLVDWLADGKLEVEEATEVWSKAFGINATLPFQYYRRTPEPPVKKLRPFFISEVPLDHWYRLKNGSQARKLTQFDPFVAEPWVYIEAFGVIKVTSLLEDWEHSPDGHTDWQACGILVEESV